MDSRLKTIVLSLILLVFAFALVYFSMVLVLLSLLNPCVIIILIVVIVQYLQWSVLLVRKRTLKRMRKSVRQFLSEENEKYYFRKLIKWKVDEKEQHIILENLRFK